jgi:hypothetical protein
MNDIMNGSSFGCGTGKSLSENNDIFAAADHHGRGFSGYQRMGSGLWLGNSRLFGHEIPGFGFIDQMMDKFDSPKRELVPKSCFASMRETLRKFHYHRRLFTRIIDQDHVRLHQIGLFS